MTAKQYFNNLVCSIIENFRVVRTIIDQFIRLLFPNFLSIPYFNKIKSIISWKEITSIYILVFTVVFIGQLVIAAIDNRLLTDDDIFTKNFFEDTENLINYIIICEAYVIVGFIFLKHSYYFGKNVNTKTFYTCLNIKIENKKYYRSVIGFIFIIILSFILSSGYATEVNNYASYYWFMETAPPNVSMGLAGYYYFFVNLSLLLFVLWVALAHLNLFTISFQISNSLRRVINEPFVDKSYWTNVDYLKEELAPFAWHTLTSKAFVLILTLNMFTWKVNEANVAVMYELAVIAIAIFGIWVFALPRYFIQFQIFKIWQKLKVNEYKDLRMPYIVGLSALMDLILISILVKALLGDAAEKLFDRLLS